MIVYTIQFICKIGWRIYEGEAWIIVRSFFVILLNSAWLSEVFIESVLTFSLIENLQLDLANFIYVFISLVLCKIALHWYMNHIVLRNGLEDSCYVGVMIFVLFKPTTDVKAKNFTNALLQILRVAR